MAYQEKVDALIEHHRKLAKKLESRSDRKLAKDIEDRFDCPDAHDGLRVQACQKGQIDEAGCSIRRNL